MRLICLFSMLGAVVLGQNPLGQWNCSQYQVQLALKEDGTYAMVHPNGSSIGSYKIMGYQLWLQDETSSQLVGYSASMADNNHLTLVDGYGTSMIFERVVQTPTGQPGTIQGPVLKEKNGKQLKAGHVRTGIGLIEFILGFQLPQAERTELRDQLLIDFETNPDYVVSQLDSINQSLNQLSTLTDAIQIGTARQQLFSALYLATYKMAENEKPLLIQVLNRHIKVLAVDEANQFILTREDAEGTLNYLAFQSKIQGTPVTINQADQETWIRELTQKFEGLSLDQKQLACSGSLVWKIIQANWNQMGQAQQQQYQSAMNQQMGTQQYQSTGSQNHKSVIDMQAEMNANQQIFNMMNNMNMQSHATSLNIIENMGGTGNYWEVTDKPYWMN